MAKKIVSIFLTLSMVVSLFASLNINVFAAQVDATETYSGNTTVEHYINIGGTGGEAKAAASEVVGLVKESKVIANANLKDDAYALYNVTKDGNGNVVETPLSLTTSRLNVLTGITDPSKIASVGDLSAGDYTFNGTKYGRNDQGYYSVDSSGITYDPSKTSDEDFVIKAAVQYKIAQNTNISDIVVGSAALAYRIGYYTILTSNDAENWTKQYAYACDRPVGGRATVNSGIQHIKFTKPVCAQYVRIEIYANINTVAGSSKILTDSNTRLYAFAVFGAPAYTYTGYTDLNKTSDLYNNTIKKGVKEGDTNLILKKNNTTDSNKNGVKDAKLEYFISSESLKDSYFGSTLPEGYVADKTTTVAVENARLTGWTDENITNQDIPLVASDLQKMFTTADGKRINDESKQYLQASYELDSKSAISQIVLVGKESNIKWNFTHYKYYFADTWDGLFEEENCLVEITERATISTVKFNTPVEAKYVGVRIIGAFGTEVTAGQAYIRTGELEVYGTAIPDDTTKTYTVTYMDGETVVETITVEEGKTIANIPAVPEKTGKTGSWDLDLTGVAITENKVVNAVYEDVYLNVTFKAEGEADIVKTVVYGGTLTDIPAVPEKTGKTGSWDLDLTGVAITENKVVNAVYEDVYLNVTFKAEGEADIVKTVVYGGTLTDIPVAPAKYGYTVAWDVTDFTNITEDVVATAVYTAKATNCTITFESITGIELGSVIVEYGNIPAQVDSVKKEIDAFTESVKKVYGYNFNGWDNEVYNNEITTDMQVRPTYKADETVTTNVYVEDVNGTELINENARYDSAINLRSKDAKSWTDAKDGGKVLIGAAEGTLYACGSEMKIYAKAEALEAPAVAIVGKINNGNFLVFAHVNVENATEYGVVFASKTAYDDGRNADFNLDDAAADAAAKAGTDKKLSYTVVKIDANNVSDFMASLNKTNDKTRYARAYIKVGEDYIYTDAICNQ